MPNENMFYLIISLFFLLLLVCCLFIFHSAQRAEKSTKIPIPLLLKLLLLIALLLSICGFLAAVTLAIHI